MKNIITLSIMVLLTAITMASETETDSTKSKANKNAMPIQVTFITPVGTNGIESYKMTNEISINVFAGYNGALKGVEVGGFLNGLRYDSEGIQVAGFGNTVAASMKGVQGAGFFNVTRGKMDGVQAAGFVNTSLGGLNGGQASGFINIVHGEVNGFQATGFSNVSSKNLKGVQLSGFTNMIHGELNGIQGTGFINVATKSSKGGQAAGFVNIIHGDLKGFQASGFVNVTTGDVDGFQASGFVNRAKNVDGFQFGFINIADTISNGAPIGFLSFVKNGYHRMELSGGETFYGRLSLKTGTEKFYNIFSVGTKPLANNLIWAYGYGIGTLKNINEKLQFNTDLIGYHVNERGSITFDLNFLSKLELGITYKLSKNFEVFGSGSMNVLVSEYKNADRDKFISQIAPYSIYEGYGDYSKITMFPGFNVGLRF